MSATLPDNIDYTLAQPKVLDSYRLYLKNIDYFLETWLATAEYLEPKLELYVCDDNSRTIRPDPETVTFGGKPSTALVRQDMFVFHLPPAVRYTRLFQDDFNIPYPHQYITLSFHFSGGRVEMSCNGRTFHGFAETYYNVPDIKYSLGSFLPNHSISGGYCHGSGIYNFEPTIDHRHGSTKAFFDAVVAWFQQVAAKNHNHDWFDYVFYSHSWYLMAREMDVDIGSLGSYFSNFKASIKNIKEKDFAYAGREIYKAGCDDSTYKKYMRELEKQPDFWTKSKKTDERLKSPEYSDSHTIFFAAVKSAMLFTATGDEKRLNRNTKTVVTKARRRIRDQLKKTEPTKKKVKV